MSHIKKVYVVTTASIDFVSLNDDIVLAIKDSASAQGVVHVVVPKSGAGLLVFENLPEVRENLAPHIQSPLLPRSFVCPFADGNLLLAPREDVLLVDCEPRSQRREVVIAVISEAEDE